MSSTLGNCQTDNQGTPLPSVGQSCNLAGMHMDASVIDQPDPTSLFGNGLMNNGMLDWEFYGVNPRVSAGANPASQNDFYGNLYSLSTFYGAQDGPMDYAVDAPIVKTVDNIVQVEKPCDCDGMGKKKHSRQQMMLLVGIVLAALFLAK